MTAEARPEQGRPAPAFSAGFWTSPRGGPFAGFRRLILDAWTGVWRVRPEVWWLLGFGVLLLAFGLALLLEPTVGRGGR